MRTRTTIAGALASGLLLTACGGASYFAPAVEIEEPVDDDEAGAADEADDDAASDDDALDAAEGDGSLDDPCADHQGREADAFIELVAPVDEQVASGEVDLVGCSNVHEATVAWTLLDGDGRALDEGFTTAECGTGCVGEFRDTVSLEAAADEPVAYLQVYSPNASDEGPRQLQLTEVIVTVG